MQDLAVLEEVLRMVLEIINSCLSSSLHHNPHLVYSLLYQRELFNSFKTHPTFQDILQNIDIVSDVDIVERNCLIYLQVHDGSEFVMYSMPYAEYDATCSFSDIHDSSCVRCCPSSRLVWRSMGRAETCPQQKCWTSSRRGPCSSGGTNLR